MPGTLSTVCHQKLCKVPSAQGTIAEKWTGGQDGEEKWERRGRRGQDGEEQGEEREEGGGERKDGGGITWR